MSVELNTYVASAEAIIVGDLVARLETKGWHVRFVFDAQGKDPVLHGLCFGRYRASRRNTLDKDEKEALAQALEAQDDNGAAR